jgi:tetratricopeptide (TPR) repeat protein
MKRVILTVIVLFSFTQVCSGEYHLDNWYHYEQGGRMIAAKNWNQAQREFSYYLHHPEMHRHMFGVAHFGLGLMYQAMGKYDSAIAEFKMAIENDLHPDVKVSGQAYLNIGAIYFRQKDYPDAADAYSNAVKISPQSGTAHYWLGMSYLRTGEIENAEKEADAAKKLGIPFTALSEDLAKLKEKH